MPFVFYGCDTNGAERQYPRPLPIQSGCTRLIARLQNRSRSAAAGRSDGLHGTMRSLQPSRQGRKIPPRAIRPPCAPPHPESRKPEAQSRKPEAKAGSRSLYCQKRCIAHPQFVNPPRKGMANCLTAFYYRGRKYPGREQHRLLSTATTGNRGAAANLRRTELRPGASRRNAIQRNRKYRTPI